MKKLLPLVLLGLAGCAATPLQRAVKDNDPAAIKAELAKGTSPDQRNVLAETPLMLAAYAGHKEAVQALIEGGADVNAGWHYGTPLAYAASRGNTEIARLLIDHGAQPTEEAAQAATNSGYAALAEEILKRAHEQSGPTSVDAPAYTDAKRPDDLAVVVGVGPAAERDADAVRHHLKALGFDDDNVVELTGEQATRGQIAARLEEWLPSRLKAGSSAVLFFAGRVAADKSGAPLLIARDSDPHYLQSTAYPLASAYAAVSKAQRSMVVLEAPLADVKEGTLQPPARVTLLASAVPGQPSGAPYLNHGLFTYFLLDGLTQGKRSAKDLYEYAAPRVEKQAKQASRDQTPLLLGDDVRL